MGLFATIKRVWSERATLKDPPGWLAKYFGGGGTTSSGIDVGPQTALTYTAVWAAVRTISETLASLPLSVYRRDDDGGKTKLPNHPVSRVLNGEYSPETVAMVGRETQQAHALTWGNGCAEIVRDGRGDVVAMYPLRPDRITVGRGDFGLVYDCRDDNQHTTRLQAADVLHIPGLGFDGLVGYSPIRVHANAIGLALGAEKFGATLFGNDARPGGYLEHPGEMKPDAHARFKADWKTAHSGDNSHAVAILENGMKWNTVTIPPEEAQFLETRRFQVAEVARIYRIPPHMIGDMEHATFTNIEHQAIEFVVHTIRPWAQRWEQEINRKLLTGQPGLFVEHNLDGLLRGDIAARYAAYAVGRQGGWLSANDVRKLENLNPLGPDGDQYLIPMNMSPATVGNDARMVALLRTHGDLLRDLCGRACRRRDKAAKRVTPDTQADHIARHVQYCLDTLTPAIEACAAVCNRAVNVPQLVRSLATDATAERMTTTILNALEDYDNG